MVARSLQLCVILTERCWTRENEGALRKQFLPLVHLQNACFPSLPSETIRSHTLKEPGFIKKKAGMGSRTFYLWNLQTESQTLNEPKVLDREGEEDIPITGRSENAS